MIIINKLINEKVPIIFLILGTFVFSHFLRNMFLPGSLHNYNLFFMFFIFCIILFVVKIDLKVVLLVSILIIIYSLNIAVGSATIGDLIYYSFNIILPMLLVGLQINKESRMKIFKVYIMILNILVFCLILMAILDKISDYSIAISYWQKADESMLGALYNHKYLGQYRFYSFMGHPLYNAQLCLMFFVINFSYNKYFKRILPNVLVTIITLIGISLTASKTGVFLLGAAILFLSPNKKKFKYYSILIGSIIIILSLGIFNDTIYRLLNTSLTTGRDDTWIMYKTMDIYVIKFFTGYGAQVIDNINNIITWGNAAFEYPIRGFSIQNGMLFTIWTFIILFIYPVIKLIKKKQYFLLIAFLLIVVDVNTYNALIHGRDYVINFGLFAAILLNISYEVSDEDIKNLEE